MVNLPVTDNDNLKRLNSIFESGKVTLSYKFYWLLAIIDELEQRQKANKSLTDEILLTDLAINMLSLALYPTVYFKLNFGFNDKLSNARAKAFYFNQESNQEQSTKEDDSGELKSNTPITTLDWHPY